MALEDQDAQIEKLKADHAGLEKEIEDELTRPYPDDQLIADLKRQKLRIKDQLLRLESA
ncbi:MAG TPA: YdcH family protein [Alphaproteobacteria bacterium]|nr:YdcH family protein [Alphaproteobacteria bacterium]